MINNTQNGQQNIKKEEPWLNLSQHGIVEHSSHSNRNLEQQFSKESVPFVTHPGGTKRKASVGLTFINQMNDKIYNLDLETDPISPKHRRYEERMSDKLDGIYISREKSKSKIGANNETTIQLRKQSRPKIEEIFNWDKELIEEDENVAGHSTKNTSPIVEEPTDDEFGEQKCQSVSPEEGKSADLLRVLDLFSNDGDLEDADSGTESEEGGGEEQQEQQQKIILSQRLRKLFSEESERVNDLLQRPKSTQITGKELIPFVSPSPLSLLIRPSSRPQIAEVEEDEEEEEKKSEVLKMEGVGEDLILPDELDMQEDSLPPLLGEEEEMDIG